MRKTILLLLLSLLAVLSASANRGGFHYADIGIEARVGADNVWHITETFDIIFEEPRHGFYRYIPKSFVLEHVIEDGLEFFPYRPRISDISVQGWPYTTEDSDEGFVIIRIGDADREVTGRQRYVVSYDYAYPDDRLQDRDYIFHTILGTEFEQHIDHVQFHLHFDKPLPDDIDERLEVYGGTYLSTDPLPQLTIEASTTDISGEATDVAPRHGITLYADLPPGYYEGVEPLNRLWLWLCAGLALLAIGAIIVCQLRQRRPHITKVIEFYPPDDICSAEVGTIIDDSADTDDLTSLIPWLAGRGYLSIKETTKGKLFKSTDLELTRLKELPKNAPAYQRRMMNLLFDEGDTVHMKDIGQKPDEIERIKKELKKRFTSGHELTTTADGVLFYLPLVIAGTLMLGLNTVMTVFEWDTMLLAAGLYGAPFLTALLIRIGSSAGDAMHSTLYHASLIAAKALLCAVTCVLYCILAINYGAPLSAWVVAAFYAVSFLLGELAGRFIVDTPYRVSMMGRLLGFKEFIETAEKPRLEQLQADDPDYFFKVMPYAMVFGLSDKWADLFSDIDVQKPTWYDAATPLYGHDLMRSMTHSFASTASDAITTISHSSDSSGGGGGGGGFSGGGGGGGGGGSW